MKSEILAWIVGGGDEREAVVASAAVGNDLFRVSGTWTHAAGVGDQSPKICTPILLPSCLVLEEAKMAAFCCFHLLSYQTICLGPEQCSVFFSQAIILHPMGPILKDFFFFSGFLWGFIKNWKAKRILLWQEQFNSCTTIF